MGTPVNSISEKPRLVCAPERGSWAPLRAIHALVWGLKFLPAFPLEQHPAASPLKCQGGRGSAQSPPLGGWPALARAAGALTQPQPGRCPPSRAWTAPSAPRAPGRHAPQRALGTASPGKHCRSIPGPAAAAPAGLGRNAVGGAAASRGWVPGRGASPPATGGGSARWGPAGPHRPLREGTRLASRDRDAPPGGTAPGARLGGHGWAGRWQQPWAARVGAAPGSALQRPQSCFGARVSKAWKSGVLCSRRSHSPAPSPLPLGVLGPSPLGGLRSLS